MFRTLLFIVILAIVVLAAVWLAGWGGQISLVLPGERLNLGFTEFAWDSYELTVPFGLLVFAVLAFSVVMALLYRFWLALRSAPGQFGGFLAGNRSRKGYRALTQGMVAVAAGDADEARKWSRRADDLLDDPPLTQLLAAQTAQLDGDEAAAKRYFNQMLEREDTRFLGLRGLLMQALREGDEAAARGLVRQAYAHAAQDTLGAQHPVRPDRESRRARGGGKGGQGSRQAEDPAGRRGAAQTGRPAWSSGPRRRGFRATGPAAIKHAQEARKLDPKLVPATILLANLFCAAGRPRDAVRMLERAWSSTRATSGPGDGLPGGPAERRSDPALQERRQADRRQGAASGIRLGARRGRARGLAVGRGPAFSGPGVGRTNPDERVCRLMARLEEAEHNDTAKSREWLMRASDAPTAPSWVCETCGTAAADWSARCEACHAYDSLQWRRPPRVSSGHPSAGRRPYGNGAGSRRAPRPFCLRNRPAMAPPRPRPWKPNPAPRRR